MQSGLDSGLLLTKGSGGVAAAIDERTKFETIEGALR